MLASYRDLEGDFDPSEFEKGFVELQSSNLNIVAHHRLFTLVGTHEYWSVYQSAMAFFTSANAVLVKQIPDAIKIKLTTTRIEHAHTEVVEEGFKEAKLQQEKSQRYVQLIAELQVLSAALESERFRFAELKSFRNKAEVKASIDRLKSLFAEDLSKYATDAQPDNALDLAQEAAQGR
ncbi:hypothetical protein CHU94_12365 [Rhodoferax sp. TH121]|uniref:hypothetical protein n=1 Tax=Rhodoferax sp. TH121 TaxID=2022803 RepID=UPI000B968090|nr:hypothetical protein [Rhodoferax sp. TH121]OYQ40116.1 hypothetical protein CHU94_12365 [Rhodoferax sp. TH121]